MLTYQDHRLHLATIRKAALRAADPRTAVTNHLRLQGDTLQVGDRSLTLPSTGRLFLIALGKAAPTMVLAAVEALGDRLSAGVASLPRSSEATLPKSIQVFLGGHPLPNKGSLAAGAAVAELLKETVSSDIVVVLVSGGGSAMLELPLPGIDLQDLQHLNTLLLRSGAPIETVNTVRRAISRIKSGGLARMAWPARVVALILSDVVGDKLSSVASGPSVLRRVSPAAAQETLKQYDLWQRTPENIRAALDRQVVQSLRARRPVNVLIGSNRLVTAAAAARAAELGFKPKVLTYRMRGEARRVGWRFGRRLQKQAEATCLLMGGETTVTVRGEGVGGRNQELALSAALALENRSGVALMSLATDGVDGPTDAAGAVVTGETIAIARRQHLQPELALENNDAYTLLNAIGALLQTGPSGTNLNDLVVGLRYHR